MSVLNRQKLQELAITRLEDARILLENERYSAARYLAGYAVECGLKACIALQTLQHEFPDRKRVNKSYSHDLEQLIGLTQIPWDENAKDFKDFEADTSLMRNWSLISTEWSEGTRYENASDIEAKDLLRAIDDPEHGVLQWLQKYW